MKAELVVETADYVGESPRWDNGRGCLWWVDAERATVHSHEPHTGVTQTLRLPANASSVAISEGDLLATMPDGVYHLNPGSGALELLVEIDPGAGTLFNDSGCDPRGRLWIGSGSETTTGLGRLWVLPPGAAEATQVLDGLSLPNGIGWTPGDDAMFLADSYARAVYRFPYDAESGALGPLETFFTASEEDGFPDGLAVDVEGGVWVAFWDGGCVRRLGPGGEVDTRVQLPVQRVAGCAFGGHLMTDLYVTTAWYELTDDQRTQQPLAGSLFRIETTVAGVPVARFPSRT